MRCTLSYVALCLGLAACGSVKDNTGHLPDAPPPPDAIARGTVNVTVLDPSGTGVPAAGASVVFLDPDGSLVKRASTDTNGKASADVLPGASVTSIALAGATYQLQTVLAIAPGDNIILGTNAGSSATLGTFTVSFPALSGANHYTIAEPCGTTSTSTPPTGALPPTTATFTVFASCKVDLMELVVVAFDANNNILGSLDQTGVAFANGTATMTGTYQSARTFTASFTNVNPIITAMSFTRDVPDSDGIGASFTAISTPSTTASTTATVPLASHAIVETTATSSTRARQLVLQNISGSGITYGLDTTAKLLPWINMLSFDAANNKIIVPTDTTGTSSDPIDMFRAAFSYSRTTTATDAGQTTTSFSWTIFGPTASDIVLPTLPADLASLAPTATDTVNFGLTVSLEMDTVTGYDAIRNDLNSAFTTYVGVRPPATTVRASVSPQLLR